MANIILVLMFVVGNTAADAALILTYMTEYVVREHPQRSRLIDVSQTIVACYPVKIEINSEVGHATMIVWKSIYGSMKVRDTLVYKWRLWKERFKVLDLNSRYILFFSKEVQDTITDYDLHGLVGTMLIDESYLTGKIENGVTKNIRDSIAIHGFYDVVVVNTDREMLGFEKEQTVPVKCLRSRPYMLDICRCVSFQQFEDQVKAYKTSETK